MEFLYNLKVVSSSYAGMAIPVIVWAVVLIIVLVKTGKKRGKAERFLLAGIGLSLVRYILLPVNIMLMLLMTDRGDIETARILARWGWMCINLIGIAGIFFSIYSFWLKFKTENSGRKVTFEQD